ncbi:hypothetical protein Mal4_15490 [Maioricimonas rarisocia]|uniref:Uncharacterized protein n=1 Tax=Maioricimonas rarisocia TaxID=2528026 RepID=A0A517Z448_9PLAN|nr:hypothetical protein [Maioricimonas rarisocia]QDU37239.1 hypothetical protein Mal4_15490 [Maioricimonas rarisocia]
MRSLIAALCTAAVLAGPVRADEITATNMDETGYNHTGWAYSVGYRNPDLGYTNEVPGQEFLAQVSGTLTTLTATVDRFVGREPLQVSVFTATANRPDILLGTVSVPETEVAGSGDPDWPMTTVDFSALGIPLVAGESYIVTFKTSTALFQSARYRALQTQINVNSFGQPPIVSKDGGATWFDSRVDPEVGLIVCVASAPPEPQEVVVDVVPGSDANRVKLNGRKLKPLEVAVLGDADLDVYDILPETALLGDPVLTDPDTGSGIPVGPTTFSYGDVDGDGDDDLLLEFDLAEMQLAGAIDSASTVLLLEAELGNGGLVYGLDGVSIKGGGKGKGNGKGNGKGPKKK